MQLTIPAHGALVLDAKHPSTGRPIRLEFSRQELTQKYLPIRGNVLDHRSVNRLLVEMSRVVLFTSAVPNGYGVGIPPEGIQVTVRGDLFTWAEQAGLAVPRY